ncbi:histone-fold-containing protein [Coniella lustricola]|uniref:NCT transcriptional regulatory complex subunit B n=1 Tax=Coniella lustricola TaxID=2025994 RepID=A0A2T3A0Z4_9PEZI|nr:histone-fold-containing protein [Coniella lustricola]
MDRFTPYGNASAHTLKSLEIRDLAHHMNKRLTWTLAADDLSLPKATVQKIVSEILPPANGVAFSKEARDLLIECCVEFITLVSSEANEISEKEAKKTIACDHITKALEQLGFSDYVPAVLEAASEHKEQQKGREKKLNKFDQSGMSMEELERLQAEQFAAAAARHN